MEMRRIRWVGNADALVRAVTQLPAGFVLESSLQANGLGRFSFAGYGPLSEFIYRVEDSKAGELDPLKALESWFAQYQTNEELERFPFTGGAVGFLAYEAAVGWIPKVEMLNIDPRIPLIEFKAYDGVFAYDHEDGSLHILAHGWEEPAADILDRLEIFAKNAQISKPPRAMTKLALGEAVSNFTLESYSAAVEKARGYIREGEVYQVNLAQRFEINAAGATAFDIYERFRSTTQAPYSACLPFEGGHLLSCSPEQLLCRTGRRLTSRPIKGTRPRGTSAKTMQHRERNSLPRKKTAPSCS